VTVKAAAALHSAAAQGKIDTVASTLVNTGLLKIDKAGHDEGGERKREKKHNLHWKYEDPALILKDLLG
jgi:transcriptional coactivator HFI1/ADA1